jgi:hypothetical protein
LHDAESDLARTIAEGNYYMSIKEINKYYRDLRAPDAVRNVDESVMYYIRT